MTLLVPNAGEDLALGCFLNKYTPQDGRLKLFKNNITPAETDTAATYTESTFTGYVSILMAGASWTITPGAPTLAAFAQQTFTLSADIATENQYGYFVVQTTSGTLMWAERFSDGPYPMTTNGDNVKVTPKITGD
jgi:hypothetical protein